MPKIACFEFALNGTRIVADGFLTLDPATRESLFVRYDMEGLKRATRPVDCARYANESRGSLGMWRYKDVLPQVAPVTLGEGWTPLIQSKRHAGLFFKQEGANPAGSCESRGFSLAVSMAKQAAIKDLALVSGGDHASAFAAYAAAAGMAAHLYTPKNAASANFTEAVAHGAEVHAVDGTLSDCRLLLEEQLRAQRGGTSQLGKVWLDVSALKEPFRLEGMKTIGYEIAEQLGWKVPDAVLSPEGSGLLGISKAFEEMEELGWIESGSRPPRLYAVRTRESTAEPEHVSTTRNLVRQWNGDIFNSSQEEVLASTLDFARQEGILLAPEAAGAAAAYLRGLEDGAFSRDEQVVIVNTSAGFRSAHALARAMHLWQPQTLPTSLPVGGIITPV